MRPTQQREIANRAYPSFRQKPVQVVDATQYRIVQRDDDIAFLESAAFGRALFFDGNNQHAGFRLELLRANDEAGNRNGLPADAEISATNAAVFDQMACAGKMTAVLMPMTSPFELTNGPPEFPGLSAASV